jgi:hypothetical protein
VFGLKPGERTGGELTTNSIFSGAMRRALILLVLLPPKVWAQTIRGSVLDDESEEAVPGVSVMLIDADAQVSVGTLSDSLGGFLLEAPRTGRYVVRCERIGYETTNSGEIDLLPPDTVDVELRMSVDAILLAPLTIRSARGPLVMDTRLASWGFYDRRAGYTTMGTGLVHFLEYEDIKKRNPIMVSDVFRDLSGVWVQPTGRRSSRVVGRMGCDLTVFVDGVRFRLGRGESIDDLILAQTLAAIEVYPRAPYPAQYAPYGNACGSIVIWTGWVSGKGKGGSAG